MQKNNMQIFWDKIADTYWSVHDLEQLQRICVAEFLQHKKGTVLELACGNGKTIEMIDSYNPSLEIKWIDYNQAMISIAKEKFPQYEFECADILTYPIEENYDYVICINSLHNLPSKEMIYSFLTKAKSFVKPGGYLIFDIRNENNPFIRYGYRKNRKKGLSFFTLNPSSIIKKLKPDFDVIAHRWIYYTSLSQAGVKQKSFLFRKLYSLYLALTRLKYLSPYQFIILQKKDV